MKQSQFRYTRYVARLAIQVCCSMISAFYKRICWVHADCHRPGNYYFRRFYIIGNGLVLPQEGLAETLETPPPPMLLVAGYSSSIEFLTMGHSLIFCVNMNPDCPSHVVHMYVTTV